MFNYECYKQKGALTITKMISSKENEPSLQSSKSSRQNAEWGESLTRGCACSTTSATSGRAPFSAPALMASSSEPAAGFPVLLAPLRPLTRRRREGEVVTK